MGGNARLGQWKAQAALTGQEPWVQRFWDKVQKGPGCWLWTAGRFRRGYGMFSPEAGSTQLAHRLSFRLAGRDIPAGHVVMHSCDTPLCVNPKHLVVGTLKDNTQDAAHKGRLCGGSAHWTVRHPERTRGRNNANARLSERNVRDIRAARSLGRTLQFIAEQYGVTPTHVRLIVTRKTWRHIP